MNIENSNLHNVLSTIILNQSLLKDKIKNAGKEIFLVENFNSNPGISGLYINYLGETRFWDGVKWGYISNEVCDYINQNSTSGTIPTTKAVYDFVNSKTSGSVSDGTIVEINDSIKNIENDLNALNTEVRGNITNRINTSEANIKNITGDVSNINNDIKNITGDISNINDDIVEISGDVLSLSNEPKLYLKDSIPSTPSNNKLSGLYISSEGESKIWNGSKWIPTSKEVSDIFSASSTSGTIPTTKGVYDFVISKLNDNRCVYYIESFENFQNDSPSGLYIDHYGESRFWTSKEWEYTSNEISNTINSNSTSGTIPTSKAVYDFVTSYTGGNLNSDLGKPEIFYVESFENFKDESPSGLYIDHYGETRFWTGGEWEYTSRELKNVIDSNSTSGTIPSTKAVYDFVINKIESINTSTSENKEIFYVPSLDSCDPSLTGFYIDNEGRTGFWGGEEWEYTSQEVVNSISDSSSNVEIPTAKAVYEFITSQGNQSNGQPEVFYIESFESFPDNSPSGLYIDNNGLTKFYVGNNEWEILSNEISDTVDSNSTSGTIPTSKAVYDFVMNNIGSGGNSGTGKPEIFYVESFENFPQDSPSGFYIDHDGESRFWTSKEWEYTSKEAVNEINENSTSGTIPTSKAVYDFVTSYTGGNSNSGSGKPEIFYVESFENFPQDSPSGLYIDHEGETRFWTSKEWEYTSQTVVEYFDDNGINSVSGYIPTVSAVYQYINYKLSNFTGGTGGSNSGTPEVFYIESFENFPDNSPSGLYINHNGQSKYWDGENWKNISYEVSNTITTADENKIPSIKAVYDFVTSYSNSGNSNTNTGANGTPEVFYIESFENFSQESPSGFYIDHDGESRFWTGEEWEYTSIESVDTINENSTSNTVPTTKAVYDFVMNNIGSGSGGGTGKPEIFYVETFEEYTPSISGLYIDHEGETRFWTGVEWEYTSQTIVDTIEPVSLNIIGNNVPTVNAVYDFVLTYSTNGTGVAPIIHPVNETTITPNHLSIYRFTLSGNESFTFTAPETNSALSFRLYLIMPSSVVTFTLPDNIIWDNAPEFTTASALYMLVFEWNPIIKKWLGNLMWNPLTVDLASIDNENDDPTSEGGSDDYHYLTVSGFSSMVDGTYELIEGNGDDGDFGDCQWVKQNGNIYLDFITQTEWAIMTERDGKGTYIAGASLSDYSKIDGPWTCNWGSGKSIVLGKN